MSADLSQTQLQQLKQLYALLAPEEGLRHLLEGLTEMSGAPTLLFDPGGRGHPPRLNREHPLVQRLYKHKDPEAGRLYLLSAMFSLLNRARPEVDDAMERAFHARVLARLLERAKI